MFISNDTQKKKTTLCLLIASLHFWENRVLPLFNGEDEKWQLSEHSIWERED